MHKSSMLSRTEFALLEQIKQNRDCSVSFALHNFSSALGINDTQALLNRLQEAGLISITGRHRDNLETRHIRLTPEGLHTLLHTQDAFTSEEQLAQQRAQQMADEKAEKRKDRRFQLLNTLLGAVIGSVLTLIVEHFEKMLVFLGNLFH